ncbi:hypothetical protein EXU30_04965 [Shewanella maritima]|uniref:Methylamine utilization protein n=2 Tax=Shewanella maritima TaxID=2520507 RepID=A0A411PMR1_9GAMM|nr:hypothetical protein EXU30_04965 [Shewanella maritima]
MALQAQAANIYIMDDNNQPMENMVVYLQSNNPAAFATPALASDSSTTQARQNPVEVHQKDKQFSPYITIVQKGYQLKFVNDDDITHHIYSASGPKRFSFKLRQDGVNKDMVFDQLGHISMGCNIHDWMSGHILIVDTPHFANTDNKGLVSFDNIAPGQYQLVVWHPQLQAINNQNSYQIDLPLSKPLTLTVTDTMGEIPSQQSLDDFEFLEGY